MDKKSFIEVAEKKFGKKRMQLIENIIFNLLSDSVNPIYPNAKKTRYVIGDEIHGCINNPDYAQAFGIMQGIGHILGYKSCCTTTDVTQPGYWFETLATQVWKDQYKKEKK